MGAVSIGYTRVNHSQLLKNKNALYPNTIVVTMEMDKEKIALSPSRDTEMMVFDTYHALNILTSNLAIYKPMDMLHNRDHQWVVWHTTLGLEKWLVRRKQGYFKKNTSTNNGLHQRRYGRIKAK